MGECPSPKASYSIGPVFFAYKAMLSPTPSGRFPVWAGDYPVDNLEKKTARPPSFRSKLSKVKGARKITPLTLKGPIITMTLKGGETASTGILNLGGIPRSYRLVKQVGNNNRRQLRLRLGCLVGQHPISLSCEGD